MRTRDRGTRVTGMVTVKARERVRASERGID
jgi:hypothetical protein